MAHDTEIVLGSKVVERMRPFLARFGEDDEAALISRALGLLRAVSGFLDADGVLTVIDPGASEGDPDGGRVGLLFEGAAKGPGSGTSLQRHAA